MLCIKATSDDGADTMTCNSMTCKENWFCSTSEKCLKSTTTQEPKEPTGHTREVSHDSPAVYQAALIAMAPPRAPMGATASPNMPQLSSHIICLAPRPGEYGMDIMACPVPTTPTRMPTVDWKEKTRKR